MNTRSSTELKTHALELRDVSKSFGKNKAVDNISLHIRPNEVIGLIGENGAGKSTLLKILAGVHEPDCGTILINGQSHRIRSTTRATELGIGVVHQEQSLLSNLTVAENILMGSVRKERSQPQTERATRFGFYNWKQLNRQAAEALQRVGSQTDPSLNIEQLSFAERQMVEIARAVLIGESAGTSPIVILDEPTSVLENEEVAVLAAEIHRLRDLGSVVFVSHRLHEIIEFTDRIYVMRGGKVVAERDSRTVNEDELFELMTGRQSAAPAHRRPLELPAGQEVALKVDRLGKRGSFTDVSFSIRKGQVHCLIGTNSSGREDVARALFGAEPFDSGSFTLGNREFKRLSIREAIRHGIAYVPAERKVEGMTGGMTVGENLTLTHAAGTRRGPFLSHGARSRISEDWITRMDVRPAEAEADIASFSGGNQQKVVLGKWLLADDLNLLMLDHPLRGLDPGAIEHVNEAIRVECGKGTAVLLLADTLEEALAIADEISVMRDGQVSGHYLLADHVPTVVELIEKMV